MLKENLEKAAEISNKLKEIADLRDVLRHIRTEDNMLLGYLSEGEEFVSTVEGNLGRDLSNALMDSLEAIEEEYDKQIKLL